MSEKYLKPAPIVTEREILDPLKFELDIKGLGLGVSEILDRAENGAPLSPVEEMIAGAAGYIPESKIVPQ